MGVILYGTRLYGAVDRVPGLCYVATMFAHAFFLPLFPLRSFLVHEGSEGSHVVKGTFGGLTIKGTFDGQPVPLDLKSVLAGYLRGWLGPLALLLFTMLGTIVSAEVTIYQKFHEVLQIVLIGLAIVGASLGTYFVLATRRKSWIVVQVLLLVGFGAAWYFSSRSGNFMLRLGSEKWLSGLVTANLALAGYSLTRLLDRASYRRAVQLGEQLDVDAETIRDLLSGAGQPPPTRARSEEEDETRPRHSRSLEDREEIEEPPRRRFRDEEDWDDKIQKRIRRERQPSNSALPWIIGGAAAAVLLLGGVVGLLVVPAFRLGKRPDAPNPPVVQMQPARVVQEQPPAVPVLQASSVRLALDCKNSELKHLLVQPKRALAYHSRVTAAGMQDVFDVHDLQSGKRLSRLEFPGFASLEGIDLSPDGSRLAVTSRTADSPPAVSVYAIPEGKAVVQNWAPYPRGPQAPPRNADPELVWTSLLGDDRVLTVTRGGRFDVWNLATREPIFQAAGAGKNLVLACNRFTRLPANLAVSADRRTLARFNQEGFDFFDTATGNLLGSTERLAGEGRMLNVWGTAFSPDGKSLACSFMRSRDKTSQMHLARWAVPTGRQEALHPIAKNLRYAAGLSWWGGQHVMLWNAVLGEALLYDLRNGAFCRQCQRMNHGRFAAGRVDGRAWFATGLIPTGPAVLAAVDLPEADLQQFPPRANDPNPRRWYFRPEGVVLEK